MDASVYAADAELEADHWWFAGRRQLFGNLIRALHLVDGSAVADIGTSVGTNLRLLADIGFSDVRGVDANPVAVEYCATRGFDRVSQGDVCDLPFSDSKLDLVLATDVVEHVEDDVAAMREIRRVLKPGGCRPEARGRTRRSPPPGCPPSGEIRLARPRRRCDPATS